MMDVLSVRVRADGFEKAEREVLNIMKKNRIIRLVSLLTALLTVFVFIPGLYASTEGEENTQQTEVVKVNEWKRLYSLDELEKDKYYNMVFVYGAVAKYYAVAPMKLLHSDETGFIDAVPLDTEHFNYIDSVYVDKSLENCVTYDYNDYLRYYVPSSGGGTLLTADKSKLIGGDLKTYLGTNAYSFMYAINETARQGDFNSRNDNEDPWWKIYSGKADHRLLKDYEFGLGWTYYDKNHTGPTSPYTYYYVSIANKKHDELYKCGKSGCVAVLGTGSDYYMSNQQFSSSCRIWYSEDEYLTTYTGSKFIVTPDDVFRIRDYTMIDEGTEFIIEPGAVAVVEGRLFNNGKIKNYGTLILEENASVITGTETSGAGTVICMGADSKYIKTSVVNDNKGGKKTVKSTLYGEGTIIINNNAKLSLPDSSALFTLEKGTSCLNNGYLIVPGGISMKSATLVNNGACIIGYAEKSTGNFDLRAVPCGAYDGNYNMMLNNSSISNFYSEKNYVEKGNGWYDASKHQSAEKTVFN